jgi:hypothetical protein
MSPSCHGPGSSQGRSGSIPSLNSKAGRYCLTNKPEPYQFLEFADDVDLAEKLAKWESITKPTDCTLA